MKNIIFALALLLILGVPRVEAQATPGTSTTQGTSAGSSSAASTAPSTTPSTQTAAPASAPGQPDLTIPTDSSKEWVVGFTVLKGEGLSPENAYLAYSLPLMLKNDVAGITAHTLSAEEQDLKRRALIAAQIALSDQAITKARKDRDALFFAAAPPSDAGLKTADDKVQAVMARKLFLESLDPSKVDVAGSKPITIKAGTGAGDLLDAPNLPADTYCTRQGLDFLVGGTLSEVQGYLLLDLWAFDATRGAFVISSREAAGRGEFYGSLSPAGNELVGALLGTPWSILVFQPQPPDASLFVDDKLVAAGVSPRLYLTPGEHLVKIAATGYRDDVRSVTLPPETQTSLVVSLQQEQRGAVDIATVPAGADLYLDSMWRGKTPLSVQRPAERARGVLSLSGFYDFSFSLDPSSPPALSFSLQPDVGSRDALQKKARDQFYTSFAWFAVSIPIPLIAYGLYYDAEVQYYDLSLYAGMETQAAAASMRANVFSTVYYAGLAVSSALFTWMVFRIIHYATVARWSSG